MSKIFIACMVLSLGFVSCKTKAPMNVGMMGCYILDGEEKEATVDKQLLKLYDAEIRIANTQSFINKLTISTNDKKYFGFILADITEKIITKLKADSAITIIEEKSIDANETTYHFYKVKKKSGLLLIKVLFKQPSLTNSIMVDAVFDSDNKWSTFYANSDAFIKKFNCKNEEK